VREISAGSAEYRFGVGTAADEPREGDDFVLCRPMVAPHRLGVSLDLGVDRIAQPEALVTELVDEFGLEHSLGSVDITNRFEQAEWEKSVDRSEHATSLETATAIEEGRRGS
jgi:hypothetical protein